MCCEEDPDVVHLYSPHPQPSMASLTIQSGHPLMQVLKHMERESEEKPGCFSPWLGIQQAAALDFLVAIVLKQTLLVLF